jgi:hypothetical protein
MSQSSTRTKKFIITEVKQPIPPDIKPNQSWGKDFDNSSGFALDVGPDYSMSVFLHQSLNAQDRKTRADFLSVQDQVIAYCISCMGEEWKVVSEPTAEDEFGIVFYTAHGKAFAAGTINLATDGTFIWDVYTLYNWITQAREATLKAGGECDTSGKCKISAGVEVKI